MGKRIAREESEAVKQAVQKVKNKRKEGIKVGSYEIQCVRIEAKKAKISKMILEESEKACKAVRDVLDAREIVSKALENNRLIQGETNKIPLLDDEFVAYSDDDKKTKKRKITSSEKISVERKTTILDRVLNENEDTSTIQEISQSNSVTEKNS